jgi:hypothetical protein
VRAGVRVNARVRACDANRGPADWIGLIGCAADQSITRPTKNNQINQHASSSFHSSTTNEKRYIDRSRLNKYEGLLLLWKKKKKKKKKKTKEGCANHFLTADGLIS